MTCSTRGRLLQTASRSWLLHALRRDGQHLVCDILTTPTCIVAVVHRSSSLQVEDLRGFKIHFK